MIIHHSAEILVHRLSRLEAGSLEASQAMVAKIRGEMMNRQAAERRDMSQPDRQGLQRLDKSA